jgi:hypothetical protein
VSGHGTPIAPPKAPEVVVPAGYHPLAAKAGNAPAEVPLGQHLAFISLTMPDGKGFEWPVELTYGTPIGRVLDNTTYPNPVDFAKARITVTRQTHVMKNGRRVESQTRWPVGWDAAANTIVASDDASLEPGDRISIDLSRQDATLNIQSNPTPRYAATPAPAARADELRVHDIITVLA